MMKQDKKGHMIARGEYQDAAQFVVIDPSDCEVFDRLLTLFDKTGDGRVMWKELMVGCACIINASFEDRLLVAMELYDEAAESCTLLLLRLCVAEMSIATALARQAAQKRTVPTAATGQECFGRARGCARARYKQSERTRAPAQPHCDG